MKTKFLLLCNLIFFAFCIFATEPAKANPIKTFKEQSLDVSERVIQPETATMSSIRLKTETRFTPNLSAYNSVNKISNKRGKSAKPKPEFIRDDRASIFYRQEPEIVQLR